MVQLYINFVRALKDRAARSYATAAAVLSPEHSSMFLGLIHTAMNRR